MKLTFRSLVVLRTWRLRRALLALGAAVACTDYLKVTNPAIIAADEVDVVRDATTLSLSARQDFAVAAGWAAVWGSFLTWEAWPAESAIEQNDFGLRVVSDVSNQLNNVWNPVARSVASNERVIAALKGTPGEETNVNVGRSLVFSGYSFVVMAETFCRGVILGGPPLTPANVLDTAITRFTRAIAVAAASAGGTPSAGTEAYDLRTLALLGRARARLQLGRKGDAAVDAALVPSNWTYNIIYADNAAARARLSNQQFLSTVPRATIVVPPDWRTGDRRVPVIPPGTPGYNSFAQDGVTPFYTQGKFTAYNSPFRLASGLEAQYIVAEATGTAAMLAVINARRTANGLPVYSGATDDASVLTEFEEQRGREFYLEGKRLGDLQRNGAAVPHVPRPGQAYFKAGFVPVGNQSCLPLPRAEVVANPNFP